MVFRLGFAFFVVLLVFIFEAGNLHLLAQTGSYDNPESNSSESGSSQTASFQAASPGNSTVTTKSASKDDDGSQYPSMPLLMGTAVNVLGGEAATRGASRGVLEAIKIATPDQPIPVTELVQNETVGKIDLWQSKPHNYSKFFSLGAVRNNTPEVGGAPYVLGLKRVLELALDNNLDIKVARAQAQQQTAAAGTAVSRFLPSFDLNYSRDRIKLDGVIERPKSLSMNFTFPVSRGGGVLFNSASQIDTARAFWKAKYAQVNDTLFNTASSYANLSREQAKMQVRITALSVSHYWCSKIHNEYARRLKRLRKDKDDIIASGREPAQNAIYQSGVKQAENLCLMRKQFKAQMYLDLQDLIAQTLAVKRAGISLAALLSFQLPEYDKQRWNGMNIVAADKWIDRWEWIQVDHGLKLDELRCGEEPLESDDCDSQLAELKKSRELVRPIFVDAALPPIKPPPGVVETKKYSLRDLIGLAARNRPEMQQFDLLRKAAKLNTEPALANLAPSLDFFISKFRIGENFGEAPTERSSGFDLNWFARNMGLADLTDFARRSFIVRESTFQYNRTLVSVITDVSNAYLDMISAEAQQKASQKASLEAAAYMRKVFSINDLKEGDGPSVQDILNAERQYVTAMFNQIDAAVQFNLSQAGMIRAIGSNPIEKRIEVVPLFKNN